jgi:paraquat-inducible protein B
MFYGFALQVPATMTDGLTTAPAQPNPALEPQAEVDIKPVRGLSSLWLLPLVAALLGGWLVYQHITQQGPVITLTFQTASGLEAGKTKIKFKEVDVGTVISVSLDPDLEHIVVSARMEREFARYLNENTRFWVVRPRVDTTGVSGLNTLISGAHIAIEPGSGQAQTVFQGLETPPVTPVEAPGLHLVLIAERAGSINVGTSIYYKQIKVGRIENRELDLSQQLFQLQAFIEAPYHELINTNTRFWNASGIDLSIGADGVKIRTESLEALVLGGITFETIATTATAQPVENGTRFTLYPDQTSIGDAAVTFKRYAVMHFDDSIRGLSPGAPVEFRGVRLGQVKDISVAYDEASTTIRLPVLVELELERINIMVSDEQTSLDAMQNLVQRGLRARLETGNILTGQLFIALDMVEDAEPATVKMHDGYPELPTVASTLGQITDSATAIMQKLEKLPLETLLLTATALLADIQHWVNAKDTQTLPASVNSTLRGIQDLSKNLGQQLEQTAQSLQNTLAQSDEVIASVGPDSALQYELTRTLRELTKVTQELRDLVQQLENNPSSVLFGR